MSRTYDPKEIAAWKAQIYGNMDNENRVEEWASTDQSHYSGSPRKNVQPKWGSSKNNDSYSSTPLAPAPAATGLTVNPLAERREPTRLRQRLRSPSFKVLGRAIPDDREMCLRFSDTGALTWGLHKLLPRGRQRNMLGYAYQTFSST
jgi:hypothetical protein